MCITDQERLNILMAEYDSVRREALEYHKFQFQVINIALVGVATIIGIYMQTSKIEVLYIIPFVTIVLGFRYIWDVRVNVA